MLEKKNFMEAQMEINEQQVQINKYFEEQLNTLISICKTQYELSLYLCKELEKLSGTNVSENEDQAD